MANAFREIAFFSPPRKGEGSKNASLAMAGSADG